MIRTIREGDRWSLQTALVHLRHAESGRRVRLMSMIHIGEAAFYTRVNEIIAEFLGSGGVDTPPPPHYGGGAPGTPKGLLLFEGLGQLTDEEIAALTPDERKVWESIAPLTDAYRQLAAALDLVAQPDVLTKPEPNWVRADLPLSRLLTLWAERRLPLLPVMGSAVKTLENAFFKRTTRLLLLQEPMILGLFRLVRGWSPGLGKLSALLVDERNDAAMKVFDSVPPDQDILFVYGAGHIDGLVAALEQRGYRKAGRDWFTAHTERIAFTGWLDAAGDFWKRAGGGQARSGAAGSR